MTLRAPLVRIAGKIVDLPSGDTVGGAPSGATGPSGTAGLTTKGDLLTYDGAVVTLGVGPDDYVLTADSAQSKGLKWAAAPVTFTGGTLTSTLVLRTGGTAAGSEPLKFVSGSLLTSATAGTMEFLSDKFYGTITTGAARKELALWDAAGTSGRIPYETTNGRLADSANLLWDNTNSAQQIGATAIPDPTIQKLFVGGSSNGPIQIQCRNMSSGNAAYGACIALNDNATASYVVTRSSGFSTTGLSVANGSEFVSTNNLLLWTINSNSIILSAGGQNNEGMRIDNNKNVTIGTGALATNATNGFLYIPTCAGVPSGTPTTKTGRVPMIYDTTNNNLYIYSSGWKKTTTFA